MQRLARRAWRARASAPREGSRWRKATPPPAAAPRAPAAARPAPATPPGRDAGRRPPGHLDGARGRTPRAPCRAERPRPVQSAAGWSARAAPR